MLLQLDDLAVQRLTGLLCVLKTRLEVLVLRLSVCGSRMDGCLKILDLTMGLCKLLFKLLAGLLVGGHSGMELCDRSIPLGPQLGEFSLTRGQRLVSVAERRVGVCKFLLEANLFLVRVGRVHGPLLRPLNSLPQLRCHRSARHRVREAVRGEFVIPGPRIVLLQALEDPDGLVLGRIGEDALVELQAVR